MKLRGFTLIVVVLMALVISPTLPSVTFADEFASPSLPDSSANFVVSVIVSGKAHEGEPQIGLVVDSRLVGQSAVNAIYEKDEWVSLAFNFSVQTRPQNIGIAFLNGGTGTPNGRAVYIRSITVNGTSLEPDQGLYQAVGSKQAVVGKSGLPLQGMLAWDVANITEVKPGTGTADTQKHNLDASMTPNSSSFDSSGSGGDGDGGESGNSNFGDMPASGGLPGNP